MMGTKATRKYSQFANALICFQTVFAVVVSARRRDTTVNTNLHTVGFATVTLFPCDLRRFLQFYNRIDG